MKFSIETSELQRAIHVLGVSAKLNTTDIEGRVLIEVQEDQVRFLSSTMSSAVSFVAKNVTVEEKDKVVVLFSQLRAFVNSFPTFDGESGVKRFNFELSDNNLVLTLDNIFSNGKKAKGKVKLPIYQTYTIAEPPPFTKATFIMSASLIKTASNKVIYAINQNESRQNIQGMNIKFNKDFISFAGTNGFMLSEYRIKNISELREGDYILSYPFVMGLRRLIADEDQLFFELDKNTIKVKFGNICYWGRVIIGQTYPEYVQEFERYSNTITLNKEIVLANLRPFIDLLNPEDNNRLRVKLTNKHLVLANDNAEFVYEEELDVDDDFEVDVNGRFMLDTIDAIKDDELVIKFSDSKGHLIFDSENYKDQKALITPVQFRG